MTFSTYPFIPLTVRNYLSEAISKLGASNRVEAARIARMKGWL
jgi:two-component system response regulator DesR